MKLLFLDCESAGLRGEIFSAAIVNSAGETVFNGFFRHPELRTNTFLRDNVAPSLTGTEYQTLHEFQKAFAECWEESRQRYGVGQYNSMQVVAHCGAPVEANFFQQLFEAGLIDEFSGPFPLLDTAPLLLQAGFDPTSEQEFAKAVGIELPAGYVEHSALSDAQLTRLVWQYLAA